MRRKRSSKTSKNWWIVSASREESYDCQSLVGSNFGFTEQTKFLGRCERMLRSWIREQLWSDPSSQSTLYHSESQNHASLRFWVAACYTELYGYYVKRYWTTTLSRRTTLHDIPQLKEFGIFISRIEVWYFRDSKENWKDDHGIRSLSHTTSKVEVEYKIILVELILTVVWWIRESWLRNGIMEIFPTLEFQSWKSNFRIEVCMRTADPQVTMLWIKEIEIAKSIDEHRTSRSIMKKDFLEFDMLDAMIASASRKLINTQSTFRKRVSVEEQRGQNTDRFLRGRQIAYMDDEYVRATGAYEAVQGLADLVTMTLQNDNVQDFDVRWDHAQLSVSEMLSLAILEG